MRTQLQFVELLKIHAYCTAWGSGEAPLNSDYGLCYNLSQAVIPGRWVQDNVKELHRKFLVGCFATWPEYSGHLECIVEGDKYLYNAGDKWAATPRGDARRRLCLHVAKCCEVAMRGTS